MWRPLPEKKHLSPLSVVARSHVGTIADQRFELQRAFEAEVEQRYGKPASACTPAEINAVRNSLGREWWDERAPQPHVDFAEPLQVIQFTPDGARVAPAVQERLPF